MNKYIFLSLLFIVSSCASSESVSFCETSKHNHICKVIERYPDASIVGSSGDSLYEQLELFYSIHEAFQSNDTNNGILRIDSINGNLVGSLPADILFEFDQYALLEPHQTSLDTLILSLISTDNPKTISIVGHTDNIGNEQYNIILSQRRAETVRNYIESKFPGTVIIRSTFGVGESSPIAPNETSEGREQNRRVELIVHNE